MTNAELRAFNNKGMSLFKEVISSRTKWLPNKNYTQLDEKFFEIIHDNKYSKVIDKNIILPNPEKFVNIEHNKRELTLNLYRALDIKNKDNNIWKDAGLWTWLSAYYLNLTAPIESKGKYKELGDKHQLRFVGANPRHIYELPKKGGGHSTIHRHLICAPLKLYSFHKDNALIFLTGSLDKMGDIIEQMASRPDYLLSPAIIDAYSNLFFDEENFTNKKMHSLPGSKRHIIRRFVDILDRAQSNFDIRNPKILTNSILNLLPEKDFSRYLQNDLPLEKTDEDLSKNMKKLIQKKMEIEDQEESRELTQSQRDKMIILSYFLAKHDRDAYGYFGYPDTHKTLNDVHMHLCNLLGVPQNSSLKRNRDKFDSLYKDRRGNRVGYYQRTLTPEFMEIHNKYKNISFQEFKEIVEDLVKR